MARGPFGNRRITRFLPFVKDDREYAEGVIRSTITDLHKVSGSDEVEVYMGTGEEYSHTSVSGRYHKEGYISILWAYPYLAGTRGGKWTEMLRWLVAHEYCHHILRDLEYNTLRVLYDEWLFSLDKYNESPEFYDYDEEPEQYDGLPEFFDALQDMSPYSSTREVEGFCNTVALMYSGLNPSEVQWMKDKVRELWFADGGLADQMMMGEIDSYWDRWVVRFDNPYYRVPDDKLDSY